MQPIKQAFESNDLTTFTIACATVVGVLVEVPAMLSVVWIVNRSKGWYEGGAAAKADTEVRSAAE